MITVIAKWDYTQMSPSIEWYVWTQLQGAFGINRFIFHPVMPELAGVTIDQVNNIDEALAIAGAGRRVFFEPTGGHTLADIPDGDIIYIFGNTTESNLGKVTRDDIAIKVASARPVDLFGFNVAAIAMAHKYSA
jgi:hypothetical protein